MKASKKILEKLIVLVMIFTLLVPIFFTATVSAVEKNSTLKDESSLEENKEEELSDLDVSEENLEATAEFVENGEAVISKNEDSIVTEEDSVIESGDTETDSSKKSSESGVEENQEIEETTESENNQEIKDYYSAEETREQAIEMMKTEQETVSTYALNERSISKTSAFINATSPYAVSVANEYGVYPSVMLAQAALESAWGTSILAYSSNYNYFGIKGSYNNKSFSKYTKEYSKKEGWTVVKADFKKYLSINATFIDYANKLTKGPDWDSKNGSWDKNFYSGTWKKNAKTYKNATKSLLNKYATDPDYNKKLNSIIETYDLTRFDKSTTSGSNGGNLETGLNEINYDEVISSTNVKDYAASINGVTDGIYSAPKGTKNSKVNSTTMEYQGEKIVVTDEKKTRNGLTWARIKLNGKYLGWIDVKGLTKWDVILSEKNIHYRAKVNRKTDGINTLPYGVYGSKLVSMSSVYYGKEVTITKEKVTNRATWSYIKGLGWIDKKGLDIEKVTSTKKTSYFKAINRKTDGINTEPYGTEGFNLVDMSSKYYGKRVEITKEATTRRGTWAFITLNGRNLGWIDKKGLTNSDLVISEKNINYRAKVNRKTDGINTLPYGVFGSKLVSMSSAYYDKEVTITKEKVTNRATWSYIKDLGWIDKKALNIEKVTSTKKVSYYKRIARKTDGINTLPYGVEGFKLGEKSSDYLGENVKVTKEATTRRGTWAYITLDGKSLGWIDTRGLTSSDVILSEKNINYTAKVIRKTDGINTLPYGLSGYKLISKSSKYYGKNVSITKEMVTNRATWSYIKDLGWIDKKGLDVEEVTSIKKTSYYKRIARKNDGINTKPYGVEGFSLSYLSSNFLGKQVKVTKEATTRRSTWAYISLDGKALGWIDIKGLTSFDVILSEKNINYTGKITRKTDGINTLPYGVEGSKLVSKSSAYYGKNVTVTREMVTNRATWVYIYSEGQALGWIDKKGLKRVDLFKKVVVVDPGHGGNDPGAQAGGYKEKNLNLIVAKKLKTKLEKAGYEVLMTRSTDKFLELSEIAAIANRANPDIFVSVHTNSAGGSGIETFSYKQTNIKPSNPLKANNPKRLLNSASLSQNAQDSLIKNTGAFNRGTKLSQFHVIRETWMPAILVEIGFIDNTPERKKLVTNSYQDKLATGIFNGIQNYFKKLR